MTDDNFIKIQKEVEDLQQMYADDPEQQTFNAMILGEKGTGKSYLLRTCRLTSAVP